MPNIRTVGSGATGGDQVQLIGFSSERTLYKSRGWSIVKAGVIVTFESMNVCLLG
jgi:hypothetical protein